MPDNPLTQIEKVTISDHPSSGIDNSNPFNGGELLTDPKANRAIAAMESGRTDKTVQPKTERQQQQEKFDPSRDQWLAQFPEEQQAQLAAWRQEMWDKLGTVSDARPGRDDGMRYTDSQNNQMFVAKNGDLWFSHVGLERAPYDEHSPEMLLDKNGITRRWDDTDESSISKQVRPDGIVVSVRTENDEVNSAKFSQPGNPVTIEDRLREDGRYTRSFRNATDPSRDMKVEIDYAQVGEYSGNRLESPHISNVADVPAEVGAKTPEKASQEKLDPQQKQWLAQFPEGQQAQFAAWRQETWGKLGTIVSTENFPNGDTEYVDQLDRTLHVKANGDLTFTDLEANGGQRSSNEAGADIKPWQIELTKAGIEVERMNGDGESYTERQIFNDGLFVETNESSSGITRKTSDPKDPSRFILETETHVEPDHSGIDEWGDHLDEDRDLDQISGKEYTRLISGNPPGFGKRAEKYIDSGDWRWGENSKLLFDEYFPSPDRLSEAKDKLAHVSPETAPEVKTFLNRNPEILRGIVWESMNNLDSPGADGRNALTDWLKTRTTEGAKGSHWTGATSEELKAALANADYKVESIDGNTGKIQLSVDDISGGKLGIVENLGDLGTGEKVYLTNSPNHTRQWFPEVVRDGQALPDADTGRMILFAGSEVDNTGRPLPDGKRTGEIVFATAFPDTYQGLKTPTSKLTTSEMGPILNEAGINIANMQPDANGVLRVEAGIKTITVDGRPQQVLGSINGKELQTPINLSDLVPYAKISLQKPIINDGSASAAADLKSVIADNNGELAQTRGEHAERALAQLGKMDATTIAAEARDPDRFRERLGLQLPVDHEERLELAERFRGKLIGAGLSADLILGLFGL
jgi:hypothetical protein